LQAAHGGSLAVFFASLTSLLASSSLLLASDPEMSNTIHIVLQKGNILKAVVTILIQ
jgi:hypothetical protein